MAALHSEPNPQDEHQDLITRERDPSQPATLTDPPPIEVGTRTRKG